MRLTGSWIARPALYIALVALGVCGTLAFQSFDDHNDITPASVAAAQSSIAPATNPPGLDWVNAAPAPTTPTRPTRSSWPCHSTGPTFPRTPTS